MKILEKIWQSWEILENFGNSSKVFSNIFMILLKFSENLRKSSENFGNGSKVIFRCFYDFLKFSEMFGNLRKISRRDGKCS